jgi:hypothetical protein
MAKVLVGDVSVNLKVYNEVKSHFKAAEQVSYKNETVAQALHQLYLKAQDMTHNIEPKYCSNLKGFVDAGSDIHDKYRSILRECLVFTNPTGKPIFLSVKEIRALQVPKEGHVTWNEFKVKK